jgi:hypothetical protein
VTGVRGVNVFEVALWCVLRLREDKKCGARIVGGGGVAVGDGVLHGPAHAFLVVFGGCDVGTMPCVRFVSFNDVVVAGRARLLRGVCWWP